MMARMMPVVLFFALVMAFFVLLTRPDSAPEKAMSRPVPAVALADFTGKAVPLPEGKWVLVNFFASWCVPCVLEHPQLVDLQKQVPIIGISYRDQHENVTAMLKSRGNPYVAVVSDKAGEAALGYGISGVPETFLISPAGQIVWHNVGPIMQDEVNEIREVINARP